MTRILGIRADYSPSVGLRLPTNRAPHKSLGTGAVARYRTRAMRAGAGQRNVPGGPVDSQAVQSTL